MADYPVLEEDGFCVRVTAHKEHGGRWRSWVQFERDRDFARLKTHPSEAVRVPNDYPNEALAVQAAYDHGRQLIARALEKH
ncbi:MAG: hypothetical protein HXX19_13495 [Rhodoferax sp.]|nr:hypothetical protein [Rhodoferax sp.]